MSFHFFLSINTLTQLDDPVPMDSDCEDPMVLLTVDQHSIAPLP
jgi:hypothetical protein